MKKRKKNKFRFFILLFIVLFIVMIGGLYLYLLSFRNSSNSGYGLASVEKKEVLDGEPVNILVMGVDIGNPNNKDEPTRTDTIMLINYNPSNETINMVSIPRDTLIKINEKNQKINAAHAIGGVKYLIQEVEKLLNLNINYYGKVNYEGFRKIIDSIGGVDMEIAQNMYYDDASQDLHINFKEGETVHLDGKKAEEFFRWRKNNDGTGLAGGDIERINNQHIFIKKVLGKFKSPTIIPRLPGLMSALPKYAETNMDPEEIIKYAYTFLKVDKDNIKISTLKGDAKYIGRISYFIYSEKANKDLLLALQGVKNDNFDRSNIKVEILNGTNINGLAGNLSSKMQKRGYSNIKTGNGEKTSKSKIIVRDIDKKFINLIKRDFNISNIESEDYRQGDFNITILLGEDFNR
ncbi:LCP family protein required for cell wall assembly [Clostridium tetanomorphum]|uniref:LCP family protein n=1 Tax=Clostridium tetanomorphum TaxID=1553 RepID=A0A923E6G0_CLOTT|nr:LCP family protein [Clostridium tetanomorphum]KAJ53821.1 membrane-bound protein lytR [Clostridium tetanomorphum DSM 665]MBC2397335.1 LCP family protein [Clostridium tetanomorphum]MBP1862554.1 LCP family protein required for cell wall assembly [Clostridium tetanomorphum]NRS85605.1 LCP family protein required for cell wall assembly [Clostridium tetanomorphum]NRZ96384.1 LCP family protein required for cell wall assembly [Clostridium tetanomorphum]